MRLRSILVLFTLFVLAAMILAAADVTGKWTAEVQGRNGPRTVTFNLKQDGSTLTGTMEGMGPEPASITNGKVEGNNVSFTIKREFNGNTMTTKYEGSVSGSEMKLKVTRPGRNGGDPQVNDVVAKKSTT